MDTTRFHDAHKNVLKHNIRNHKILAKGSRSFHDEICKRQEPRSWTSLSQNSFSDRTLDNDLYTSNGNNNDLLNNEYIEDNTVCVMF